MRSRTLLCLLTALITLVVVGPVISGPQSGRQSYSARPGRNVIKRASATSPAQQIRQANYWEARGAFLLKPQFDDGNDDADVPSAPEPQQLNLPPGRMPYPPEVPLVPPPMELSEDDNASETDLLLQTARNAVQLNRPATAIERFTEYLRRRPGSKEVRVELAGVLLTAGRTEAAAAQYEHLLQTEPDNLEYLNEYAKTQMVLQRYDTAETALLRLVDDPSRKFEAAIELAMLYASTRRVAKAHALYERILRFEIPKDREQQLRFARLLATIHRPAEAMDLLIQLRATNPEDMEVLQLIILTSARSGDATGTLEFIAQLAQTQPENLAIRYEIAEQLFQEGLYRDSMMVDQQILDLDPTNVDAVVRSARSNLKMYDADSAFAILSGVSGVENDPNYQSAFAEYHSLVGEHADAIALYRRVLADDPMNANARIGLGQAFDRSEQHMRAAAEFAKVQPLGQDDTNYVAAQVASARSLARARRFGQATQVLESLYSTNSDSDSVLDAYIDVFAWAEEFPGALRVARNAMHDPLGRTRRQAQLRGKLGLLLARSGDYSAGLKELAAAESLTTEPTPEVVYGQYLAHVELGNPQAAEAVLARHMGTFGSDTFLRVRVAELATEDCKCCVARKVLLPLQRFCGDNLIVMNRLGDACVQCSTCDASENCKQYYENVLGRSPSNVQAMVGLARTNVRAGEFEASEPYFERAMRHMPRNVRLVREAARMMEQWHGPRASQPFYDRAIQLASGDYLVAEAAQGVTPMAGIEYEYQSLAELNSVVATEMASGAQRSWRPVSAMASYEGLLQMEPSNTGAIFEIGQLLSRLNRTNEAIGAYERLLCIDPCHRESKIAIQRAQLEMDPQFIVDGRYRQQRGRSDLASINRYSIGGFFQMPLGDEDEYVRFGYTRSVLSPTDDDRVIGDIPSFRVQYKPFWQLLTWAQLEYANYDSGFTKRINFDVGLQYQFMENATFRAAGLRQNVAENGESIRQDINRTGVELGINWLPIEPLRIDLIYRYWNYSDDNEQHDVGVHTGYRFFRGRTSLYWLLDLDAMHFREQTQFGPGGLVAGAVHPYFSPDSFGFVTTGLQMRHFLSCDMFKGANRHWYELFLGARLDSEGHGYGLVSGSFAHDVSPRFTYSGFFNVIQSSVYDVAEAGGQLVYRF